MYDCILKCYCERLLWRFSRGWCVVWIISFTATFPALWHGWIDKSNKLVQWAEDERVWAMVCCGRTPAIVVKVK
jgi:hypothetical protein